MSNPEHFIDEVTEELRRDRLFGLMRKYGWIAIMLVLLVVGGAAYSEWQKSKARQAAENLGDAVAGALALTDPAEQAAAFADIRAGDMARGDARALVALLAVSGTETGGDAALNALEDIRQDASLPQLYRDLAVLKLVAAGHMASADQIAALGPLAVAGAPFRALAEEQIALAEVAAGDEAAAISRLQVLLQDDDASQALRGRAAQLIVALGATPEI